MLEALLDVASSSKELTPRKEERSGGSVTGKGAGLFTGKNDSVRWLDGPPEAVRAATRERDDCCDCCGSARS